MIPLAALAATLQTPELHAGGSSPARRAVGTASAQIMVRIINASAPVGKDYTAPLDARARHATTEAADGSLVPALVYDFE